MKVKEPDTARLPDNSIAAPMCAAHPDSIAVIKSMVNRNIQSVISYGSTISVECDNGVVTLLGFFANTKDKNSALRVAISNPCVCKVVNKAKLTTA